MIWTATGRSATAKPGGRAGRMSRLCGGAWRPATEKCTGSRWPVSGITESSTVKTSSSRRGWIPTTFPRHGTPSLRGVSGSPFRARRSPARRFNAGSVRLAPRTVRGVGCRGCRPRAAPPSSTSVSRRRLAKPTPSRWRRPGSSRLTRAKTFRGYPASGRRISILPRRSPPPGSSIVLPGRRGCVIPTAVCLSTSRKRISNPIGSCCRMERS